MSEGDLEVRARPIQNGGGEGKSVCYWMSREQRCQDNHALAFASKEADQRGLPLLVFFALSPSFIGAAKRNYDFMLDGMAEVEKGLTMNGIGFRLVVGEPMSTVPDLLSEIEPAAMVIDFDPLRPKRLWRESVCKESRTTVYEVDAHNIVPCWVVSNKREWGAATLRRKLSKLLPSFLDQPPSAKGPRIEWRDGRPTDWKKVRSSIRAEDHGGPTDWIRAGEAAALEKLDDFIAKGLSSYQDRRNDPNKGGQSDLSPYIHFGQLSPQRIAFEVSKARVPGPSKQAFLEELIVRRELSDNFCLHVPDYDSVSGFPEWSKASLEQHRHDEREYVYSSREFEEARTHDPLWNAAQNEMVRRGKMHGYMRMYWAKKILEWSETPEEAMRIAIFLNDRYELDGRDPNGYAGIAWSIGGVHDRAWPSRKIFGKVRYMSYGGARSKFDVDAYVAKWI